jgi:hypothetical protein
MLKHFLASSFLVVSLSVPAMAQIQTLEPLPAGQQDTASEQPVSTPFQEAGGDFPSYADLGITPTDTGIDIPGTNIDIGTLFPFFDGSLGDSLLSRNSGLSGLFTNTLSGPYAKAVDRLNGNLNDAAALLGYGQDSVLQAGVSIDQRTKSGIGIPNDVAQEFYKNLENRYGAFADPSAVLPAQLREAAASALKVSLYSDKTNPEGGTEYGYFTKKGTEQRLQRRKKENEDFKKLQKQVTDTQQVQLNTAATGYQSSSASEAKVQGAATAGQAEVSAKVGAVQSAQSTQLAIKALGPLFVSQSKLYSDVEKARSQAKVIEQRSRAAEVNAAKIAAGVAIASHKELVELNKSAHVQEEKSNQLLEATNRAQEQDIIDAKTKQWQDAQFGIGATNIQGLRAVPDFSRAGANEAP